jgi:hypothetical protein
MKRLATLFAVFALAFGAQAQGLEDIFVETYYVSDANDATDTDGGNLPEGSVTYRIFVDMAPGYELQAVYGNSDHLLRIETSTLFFNNEDRGETTGDAINDTRLDENTVALDSWLSMGASSDAHLAVPKSIDTDGSIIGGANNDGGSEGVAGGLLANADPAAGIPLTSADGIIPGTLPSGVVAVGINLDVFADVNDGPIFTTSSGAWSVLEGVTGPTPENMVIIAQITTDGELSFELNVQIQGPGGEVEQYVASNPIGNEQLFPGLTFPAAAVEGCTDATACNFDPAATLDDGTCTVPVAGCSECSGDQLVLIDTDGDGVCDAEEIAGCQSDTACNFNPAATDDDGSCIEPTPGCTQCNATNDGLDLIDADGDGVCDADEVSGCTSEPTACNYNPAATDEEPCIIPIPNCAACNANNDGLVLIDSDGDGICDADDVCLGDFDNSGLINSGDLLQLLSTFGCSSDCGPTDLDNNGTVNSSDLLTFLSLFGTTCN